MTDGVSPEKCHRCQGPLIRRNPLRLLAAGVVMCATSSIAFWIPAFRVPGIILLIAGAYLIAWATVAKGVWCRQCKTFPGRRP